MTKFVNDGIQINTKYSTFNVKKMESLILASKEQVKARFDFVNLLEKHQVCHMLFDSS